jgi:hypothetical protein
MPGYSTAEDISPKILLKRCVDVRVHVDSAGTQEDENAHNEDGDDDDKDGVFHEALAMFRYESHVYTCFTSYSPIPKGS